ncbi:hypothetical protein R3P38DRAFT_3438112 [Favolaschia claudopus]|uniref:Uncharacterized protein n=1 Tax=Favolaschia claudopus TaxID=2862362 RepID=A0AAV9ZSQ9_9AGAR
MGRRAASYPKKMYFESSCLDISDRYRGQRQRKKHGKTGETEKYSAPYNSTPAAGFHNTRHLRTPSLTSALPIRRIPKSTFMERYYRFSFSGVHSHVAPANFRNYRRRPSPSLVAHLSTSLLRPMPLIDADSVSACDPRIAFDDAPRINDRPARQNLDKTCCCLRMQASVAGSYQLRNPAGEGRTCEAASWVDVIGLLSKLRMLAGVEAAGVLRSRSTTGGLTGCGSQYAWDVGKLRAGRLVKGVPSSHLVDHLRLLS